MIRRFLARLFFRIGHWIDPDHAPAVYGLPIARALPLPTPAHDEEAFSVESVRARLKAIDELLTKRAAEREEIRAELLQLKAAAERHQERLKQLARDGRTLQDPYPFP